MAINEKKPSKSGNAEMARRFKQSPFIFIGTFIVLVIVVVAFVLVPAIVPEYGRGRTADLTFGYYDGVPISYVPGNYFAQYREMILHSRQNTMDNTDSPQIWREAFEAAAIHTAILREMKKSGYTAPEKMVNREVALRPQFQENGRFSRTLYRRMDENERLSLWRQVQEEIAASHYLSDIKGLLKPSAETAFIGKMGAIERSFEMAAFSVDAYPETEYSVYVDENSDLFRSARLSIITVNSSEREAQKILNSIKDGETTFEDAARAYSADRYADRGGDMGLSMSHELRFDISDETDREKVIALRRGEYSDIIKTDLGWAFFRAEENIQEADTDDPAVMDKVRSYVRNYARGRMEDWAIAQADSFIELVHDIGFKEAIIQKGLIVRSFGPLPVNYGNIYFFNTLPSAEDIPELVNSAVNENFWQTAFSTPVDSPSQPVVQGSNVLVLFPTSETEAEESELEVISSIYSGSMDDISLYILQQYLMRSPKMEDKFYETYQNLFMRQ